jgi:hypothetical protein
MKLPISNFFPFIAGIVDTHDEALFQVFIDSFTFGYLHEFSREKNLNGPHGVLSGPGEIDS